MIIKLSYRDDEYDLAVQFMRSYLAEDHLVVLEHNPLQKHLVEATLPDGTVINSAIEYARIMKWTK